MPPPHLPQSIIQPQPQQMLMQQAALRQQLAWQQMLLRQGPSQIQPLPMSMYGDFPVERVPLFQPKGYVPKAGAGHRMDGVPQPKDMFRSAVKFISPVAYHPGDPGKNVSQNVLSVELGALYHNVELATGDPVRCEKCGAIFCASDAPSLTKADDDDSARCWTCKLLWYQTTNRD